jgi:hypothetical protein
MDPVSVMPCVAELRCGLPDAGPALWLPARPYQSSELRQHISASGTVGLSGCRASRLSEYVLCSPTAQNPLPVS